MVLGEFGINLGPLIAGAGIIGVALGFGSQSLVRDFLSGIFILVEDQYGVGDIVDLGEATGVVEVVSLRTTRVRSVDGTVWHVPNGAIDARRQQVAALVARAARRPGGLRDRHRRTRARSSSASPTRSGASSPAG